ncbi:phage tail protein [Pectobacterium parmentieri]|uniref:tail fiber protein n=1 Tax=Pectobacterium parmentieri TaxID=1905730 RepID=UPI000EB4654A|nr:tail fiber protein [Pectobacterium parmentieri]AYH00876.1 phage tail protein [Pectobacterium parmentieri]
MDQKFFRVPFASSGDRQTIPDATQTSGAVSFPSGWGGDYAKDPTIDANAKPVEREAMNAILYAITNAVRQYQVFGFPEYITPADNNGGAFSYSSGAVVRYRAAPAMAFKSYVSIAENNTSVPGTDATKWQEFIYQESTEQEAIDGESNNTLITPRRLHDGASYLDEQLKTALTPYLLPIGAIIMWPSVTPPDGWLELNGQQFNVTENPKLAAMFPDGRLPDYRDRFPRGWSNGSLLGGNPDREIGSMQGDAIRNITGTAPVGDSNSTHSARFTGAFYATYNHGAQLGSSALDWDNPLILFDASRVVPTADENRPVNIATMFIIKTDKADSTPGVPVPSAVVVTPRPATVNAGTFVQFSGQVLPSNFASQYPVSWSVSDAALGSIDATGRYTAIAGRTGSQSVIASISTGLTTLVTFDQHIYLTSISITAIPTVEVEGTYNLAVTFNPANYTEPADYASSDAQIASVVNGTVTGVGAGTATASVTGRYSSVTASRPVTVTPQVIVEKYLQISERLSEIAAAGSTAQAAARSNLGLGGLATKDALTATDVGAVPQANASLGTENLNTVISLGRKFQSLTSNATLARNYPVDLAGMLDVIRTTDAGIRQSYYPYNSTDVYHRYCVDTAANPIVFSAWGKSGGDYLEKSQNLLDVPNKPTARDNLGVGYTISTAAPPTSAAGYAQGHIWYQVGG